MGGCAGEIYEIGERGDITETILKNFIEMDSLSTRFSVSRTGGFREGPPLQPFQPFPDILLVLAADGSELPPYLDAGIGQSGNELARALDDVSQRAFLAGLGRWQKAINVGGEGNPLVNRGLELLLEFGRSIGRLRPVELVIQLLDDPVESSLGQSVQPATLRQFRGITLRIVFQKPRIFLADGLFPSQDNHSAGQGVDSVSQVDR